MEGEVEGEHGSVNDPLQRQVWAFDVDGTLVGSIRSDVLRPGAADVLAVLRERGDVCVLWSAGGADYAQRTAQRHGIDHHFEAFYDKPDRRRTLHYTADHFDPAHQRATFVDDSPADLHPGLDVVAVSQFVGGNPADTGLTVVLDSQRR